jgi:hypothetical protein
MMKKQQNAASRLGLHVAAREQKSQTRRGAAAAQLTSRFCNALLKIGVTLL